MRRFKKIGPSSTTAFSYSRAAKTSIAHHSSRRTPDPCIIFSIDSSDHQSDDGTERSSPRICGMAVVWTLNVSNVGARRASWIEDRISDGQRTSGSATVGGTLGASRGIPRQTRASGGGLGASVQRHFWVRNAPYAVKARGNPLKSQQMRPPLRAHHKSPLEPEVIGLFFGCCRGRVPRRSRGGRAMPPSRGAFCVRVLLLDMPSQTEGTGNAGCWPHPWPACNKKSRRQSPQVQPRQPAFPAQWF